MSDPPLRSLCPSLLACFFRGGGGKAGESSKADLFASRSFVLSAGPGAAGRGCCVGALSSLRAKGAVPVGAAPVGVRARGVAPVARHLGGLGEPSEAVPLGGQLLQLLPRGRASPRCLQLKEQGCLGGAGGEGEN